MHAKDVTEKLLTQKVDSLNAFEWISQLRYYLVKDENGVEDMFVRCI